MKQRWYITQLDSRRQSAIIQELGAREVLASSLCASIIFLSGIPRKEYEANVTLSHSSL